MTATQTAAGGRAPDPDPDIGSGASGTPPDRILGVATRTLRIVAVTAWVVALVVVWARNGIPIDRNLIIIWTITGLMAASIGRRPLWTVARDWLALAALLVAYDLTRGAADALGRATSWTPQLRLEQDLFGGIEPTIWLQAHLKQASAPPWEVVVSCTYVSFFIVPYAVAGVLWLRRRDLWRRFILRFVVVSLLGLVGFILFPAAPPWAAAQCTAAEVATHPSDPACLQQSYRLLDNGLLGPIHVHHYGASPYVERIAVRGFDHQGLRLAAALVDEGQAGSNQVAAIPSLHGAISLLVSIVAWPLLSWRWRPVLIAYPLVMAFSLVYSAEHYMVDILAGWAVTVVVCLVGRWGPNWRRRKRVADADTLVAGRSAP